MPPTDALQKRERPHLRGRSREASAHPCATQTTETTGRPKFDVRETIPAVNENRHVVTSSTERAQIAKRATIFGWREVEQAPDNSPAVRLRIRLAACRAQGLDFDAVWIAATQEAVGAISYKNDRSEWICAFDALEEQWRAAYERTAAVLCRLADTLDDFSSDASALPATLIG